VRVRRLDRNSAKGTGPPWAVVCPVGGRVGRVGAAGYRPGVLLLYGLAVAQMLIFLGVTYGLARAFGLAPRVIALGMPPVLRVRRASPEVRVGPLPSASIELFGDAVEDGQRVTYRGLSRAKRVAIVLAPWVIIVGIAIACVGVEALRSFVRGLGQWLWTADLTPLVRRMIAVANDAPLSITVGIAMAKLAAMNLLPFGGIAGGMLLTQLLTPAGRETPKAVTSYMMITLLVWMLWTLGRCVWVVIELARQ
jgi:hypothetical protein